MMNLYLKLKALIEIAICNDFDDDEREGLSSAILPSQHFPHLWKIDPEFFLTHFIIFLGDFLDEEVEFFWVINRKVNIDGEKTHESQHDFLLESIIEDFWMNDWEF